MVKYIAAILTLLLVALTASSAQVMTGERPNKALTPGAVRTTDRNEICNTRTRTIRNVPDSVKQHVYVLYGLKSKRDVWCNTEQGCEVDHLVSLELGGSNEVSNLWPEPYQGTTWNAHAKDVLENKLHKLICVGQITPQEAQSAIATDWIAAYKRYVGGTPALQEDE